MHRECGRSATGDKHSPTNPNNVPDAYFKEELEQDPCLYGLV